MTYIYRPLNGGLIFHLHPEGSRRSDLKTCNLAINPDSKFYPALRFDGIDDYVVLPTSTILNPGTQDFSIFIQFSTSTIAECIFISKRIDSLPYMWPYIIGIANGTLYFRIRVGDNEIRLESQNRYNDKKWHNLLCQRFGNIISLKVDSNDTKTSNGFEGYNLSNSQLVYIARETQISTRYYLGDFGKIMYFKRNLSDEEYDNLCADKTIDLTNIVFDFNKNGSGSILTDYSGNNINGTITGATWQDGKMNGTLTGGVSYKNSPSNNPVYNFDGTGYIRATPVRSARSNMSVFTWARAAEESYLLGRYDTGLSDRSWIIGTDIAGEKRLRVLLSDDGTYGASHSKDYLTTANVFDGSWHLYGFTWNAGALKLFVDGKEQSVTKTYDAAFSTLKAANTDLVIGARFINGSPAAYLTGQQGHQWIFNKTLPSSEAMQLFNDTRRYYGR